MQINTISVIGAGREGREIAYAAAVSGFRTILEDMSAPRLQQGWTWIRQSLEERIARGRVREQQNESAIAQLSTARSIEEASREADLIIEAAPNEMEVKLEIFTLLDKFAKPGSIFASNTSSLPIAEIAAITFRPEKCIGMHFATHLSNGEILQIICTAETSPDTVESCREVGRRMGREVIVEREWEPQ
jgi:3-hydroxybutyryl-CoA dehydrogenase